jgi:hypothetical protein
MSRKKAFPGPWGEIRTQVDAPSDRVQLSANLGDLQRLCADDLSVVYFVITDKFLNAARFKDQ